ncbi:unnamed protein product [Darwinula stevensoni]|uniref:Uncharacterized protein n=1 Tax=Darwinula stevensoni TaxID=69355 RepID=A0A7R9A6E8_9CRUS|nr:unnamed protein product [Darwinula stevensoni]CAG0894325.1 unnamed protein product [Darwinula stevensoni]
MNPDGIISEKLLDGTIPRIEEFSEENEKGQELKGIELIKSPGNGKVLSRDSEKHFGKEVLAKKKREGGKILREVTDDGDIRLRNPRPQIIFDTTPFLSLFPSPPSSSREKKVLLSRKRIGRKGKDLDRDDWTHVSHLMPLNTNAANPHHDNGDQRDDDYDDDDSAFRQGRRRIDGRREIERDESLDDMIDVSRLMPLFTSIHNRNHIVRQVHDGQPRVPSPEAIGRERQQQQQHRRNRGQQDHLLELGSLRPREVVQEKQLKLLSEMEGEKQELEDYAMRRPVNQVPRRNSSDPLSRIILGRERGLGRGRGSSGSRPGVEGQRLRPDTQGQRPGPDTQGQRPRLVGFRGFIRARPTTTPTTFNSSLSLSRQDGITTTGPSTTKASVWDRRKGFFSTRTRTQTRKPKGEADKARTSPSPPPSVLEPQGVSTRNRLFGGRSRSSIPTKAGKVPSIPFLNRSEPPVDPSIRLKEFLRKRNNGQACYKHVRDLCSTHTRSLIIYNYDDA